MAYSTVVGYVCWVIHSLLLGVTPLGDGRPELLYGHQEFFLVHFSARLRLISFLLFQCASVVTRSCTSYAFSIAILSRIWFLRFR